MTTRGHTFFPVRNLRIKALDEERGEVTNTNKNSRGCLVYVGHFII